MKCFTWYDSDGYPMAVAHANTADEAKSLIGDNLINGISLSAKELATAKAGELAAFIEEHGEPEETDGQLGIVFGKQ